jgi:Spy/CpxP family protein refolding chaperone
MAMNTKYKLWIVLSLVAVFVIGLATGYLSERYLVHRRSHGGGQEGRRPPHFPTVESLARDLDLTPDQQERIREIFKGNEARLKAFGDEFHKRLDEIRAQLKKEIDAVLTAEQIKKLEAMISEYMKKDGMSHKSASGGPSRREDQGDKK